jgi:hypothetical protein
VARDDQDAVRCRTAIVMFSLLGALVLALAARDRVNEEGFGAGDHGVVENVLQLLIWPDLNPALNHR